MLISAICTVVLLAVKITAYLLTHSQAIFADMMESILHLGTVIITSISLWYASKPPDHEHRYGHGKVAYFAAGFEGILVLVTGGGTLYNNALSYYRGYTPHDLGIGLILISIVVAVNLALGYFLVRTGKNRNNTLVTSHGYHVLSDMWTSAGVIISLIATWLTGYAWLDAAVGALVALWILYLGGTICLQAFQGLMERMDEHVNAQVVALLEKAREENVIYSYHQLRHRRVNDHLWIDIHLLFEGNMPLYDAHQRATQVEMRIIEHFPKDIVHVNTHLEPQAHQAAHPAEHPDQLARP